ncbi:hypothetical protein [Rhizomicrobium electricum]|uniref:hypothetical protein n=1 Tax=Rhizomicrobium electricum TaxID=480070 RepID=UPI0014226482|nr:hypothetical protein [Rhizomicrobium electricum]NIJ48758.1 hypothetical protein [Rhizomicrobium electricum]
MFRTILLLTCICFLTEGEAAPPPPPPLSAEIGPLYLSAQRTNYMRIGPSIFDVGEYDADDLRGGATVTDNGSGGKVADCTNELYRCVQVSYLVFAVPKGPLTKSAAYVVAGARITVEKCYRAKAGKCLVALMSSDCRWKKNEACIERPDSKNASPGPLVYFYFNWRYGVTAFGLGDKPVGIFQAEQIGQSLILQGSKGILSLPSVRNSSSGILHEGSH